MNLKKTILAVLVGSTALAALPAFAGHDDDDDWHEHRRFHRQPRYYQPYSYYVVEQQPVVVYERPVVIYRQPPPVVYQPAPVTYQPAPVVYAAPPPAPAYANYGPSGFGTLGGAIAGTVIGSRFGKGDGRTAAMVIGGVTGAFVGDRLAR
jgi:hypothetical protein